MMDEIARGRTVHFTIQFATKVGSTSMDSRALRAMVKHVCEEGMSDLQDKGNVQWSAKYLFLSGIMRAGGRRRYLLGSTNTHNESQLKLSLVIKTDLDISQTPIAQKPVKI